MNVLLLPSPHDYGTPAPVTTAEPAAGDMAAVGFTFEGEDYTLLWPAEHPLPARRNYRAEALLGEGPPAVIGAAIVRAGPPERPASLTLTQSGALIRAALSDGDTPQF